MHKKFNLFIFELNDQYLSSVISFALMNPNLCWLLILSILLIYWNHSLLQIASFVNVLNKYYLVHLHQMKATYSSLGGESSQIPMMQCGPPPQSNDKMKMKKKKRIFRLSDILSYHYL